MRDSTRLLPGSPRAANDANLGRRAFTPWTGTNLRARAASKQLSALGPVLYAAAIGDDVIKIGYTTDVVRRLDHLRSTSGQDCRLLAIRFGTMDDELDVHHSLAAHRSSGREYYYPHPEVWALVNQWRQAMGQPPAG